jgi:hypothetical protein
MSHDDTPSNPPKNVSLVPIFVIGLVLLVLFWLGTKALVRFAPEVPDAEAIRYKERAEIYLRVSEQAAKDLNQYAWRNKDAGQVQIPVQRAMELVALELAANPGVRPANFIDPLRAAAEEGALVTPEPAAPAAMEETPTPASDEPSADAAVNESPAPAAQIESSEEAVSNE